jgi:lysophospholipase L1-like esterase
LFLRRVIQKCISKKVNVILLSTPVYTSYYSRIPIKAIGEVNSMLDEYKKVFGVTILDFSLDKSFTLQDFKDDNHLNPKGAEKLTQKLDSVVHQL